MEEENDEYQCAVGAAENVNAYADSDTGRQLLSKAPQEKGFTIFIEM